MKRLSLLILSSCFLWSPNPKHRYRVIYEDGYQSAVDENIAAATEQAFYNWQEATNRFDTFTFPQGSYTGLVETTEDTSLPTISIKGETLAELDSETEPHVAAITYWHGEDSEIKVPYDFDDQAYLLRVLTHEAGHAFAGLYHTGAGTMMYWNTDGASPTITCADVSQVCTRYDSSITDKQRDCDPMTMPPCQVITTPPKVMMCNVWGVSHSCDPSDPYVVQVGDQSYASCQDDLCENGQTCYLDTVEGVCELQ